MKINEIITHKDQSVITKPTELNPKIDKLNGPDFKLNNKNIRPVFTEKDIQMAMQSKNDKKRPI